MLFSDLASGPAAAAGQVLAVNVLDPTSLLSWAGALAVLVVLFAETGLLVGFFLPGDSLLFTAGLFCSTAAGAAVHLQLGWVLPAAAVGALAGAQVGYLIGRRAGPALLARDRPRLAAGMRRAQELLDRYGYGKAIVLARFIPVVRTVLNPLAGVIGVPARTFALWQVIGGLVWSVGVTLAGYALGSVVPNVDRYLLPVIAAVVVVSLLPLGLELRRSRRRPPHHSTAATDEPVR
ncbi:DedA family protein [Pseudonocardia sp. GCM10023141]|uniref:DedA family protein n=1 Tax=Pseudonocardia sp. GCM10023141 TaxID=3252653 RepID=UPI00361DF610